MLSPKSRESSFDAVFIFRLELESSRIVCSLLYLIAALFGTLRWSKMKPILRSLASSFSKQKLQLSTFESKCSRFDFRNMNLLMQDSKVFLLSFLGSWKMLTLCRSITSMYSICFRTLSSLESISTFAFTS